MRLNLSTVALTSMLFACNRQPGAQKPGAPAAATPVEAEAPTAAGQMPPGHPAVSSAGMLARQMMGSPALPPGHPAPSAPADVGAIQVARAPGPFGRTVADVRAQKSTLKDHTVTVRGKIVKTTNGVLGKNWLHLRDGSGPGGSADLTVASQDTASVGDTVLVTGIVHLDRDLGAGYFYDVLLEDARVQTE